MGVTLLSVEGSSEVTDISLSASGIDGITDGVGVPSTDATWGDEPDGPETDLDAYDAGEANGGIDAERSEDAGVGDRLVGES